LAAFRVFFCAKSAATGKITLVQGLDERIKDSHARFHEVALIMRDERQAVHQRDRKLRSDV